MDSGATAASLASLLRRCASSRSLQEGRQAHELILRRGMGSCSYLANLLVYMYGSCRCAETAFSVFQSTHPRNAFSWNMLINAFAQNGHLEDARLAFSKMALTTVVSWTTMLAALAKAKELGEAKQMFDSMPERNSFSWNTVVNAFAAAGHLHGASQVFSRMPSWVIVSWNTLIAAYADRGHVGEARLIFDSMPLQNLVSWNTMINAYVAAGNLDGAKELFNQMPDQDSVSWTSLLKAGDGNNLEELLTLRGQRVSQPRTDHATLVSCNALIQAYASCGRLGDARRLFDSMPVKDVASWTALLTGYAHNGEMQSAETIFFETMPRRDVVAWDAMITAYAQKGWSQRAGEVFNLMPQWDVVAWNSMIQAYSVKGWTGHAQSTFAAMPERNVFSWTLALGSCQDSRTTRKMFDSMPERNSFSWNILMSSASSDGLYDAVRSCFDKMPAWTLVSWNTMIQGCSSVRKAWSLFEEMPQRDLVSWNTLLAAVAEAGKVAALQGLATKMPKQNPVTWTIMLHALAGDGQLHQAKELFEGCPGKDAALWNVMVTAYAQNEHGVEALTCFRLMDLEGIPADGISMVNALDVCGGNLDITMGRLVHHEVLESQCFFEDAHVGTAVVSMYTKCGSLPEAYSAFACMHRRDVISWNAMVAAFAHTGHIDLAATVFHRAPARDTVSWTSMVTAYAQNQHLDRASDIFQAMPDKDVAAWNAIISAHSFNGQSNEAAAMLPLMDLEGVLPDGITYASVVEACSNTDPPDKLRCRMVHEIIAEQGYTSDVVVATALLSMYAKCGLTSVARELFEQMPKRSTVSWNAMIGAYAQHGQGDTAFGVLYSMALEGLPPDGITFLSGLTGCSHVGLLDKAIPFFVSMTSDFGIRPTMSHYACLVDLLGRSGRLKSADDLVNNMPFQPDNAAWLAMLASCKNHEDRGLGRQAAGHIVDRSSAPYVLLSSISVNG